jgi:intein/homing endonuclease
MEWKSTLGTLQDDVVRMDQLIRELETYRDEKTAQIAHYLRVDEGIELDLDAIRATLTRPYTLLPINEHEAWLIHWRGVKMPIFGWVVAQEPAFLKAKVTRSMDLLTPLPAWMKDELGWKAPEHKAIIDGTRTGITLTEGDAGSFRRKYGKHLDRTQPDGSIKIKGGDAWIRLVAALVKDGILPYAPKPVAAEHWDLDATYPQLLAEIIEKKQQEAGADYIFRAISEFRQKGAVLVNYPPGSGKTLTTCAILNHFRGRVLLLADTTMLIDQWRDRLAKFAPKANVTLSTYQGAQKYLSQEWDLIVPDEAQRLPANTFSKLAFIKTKYRLGLSVGGDSMVTVESSDGIFHCSISDLYKALSCGQIEGWINVSGIRVRAFDGQNFVWKPIRSMLRHQLGTKKAFRIWTEKGRSLLLTEDHSIYRVGSHSYEYVHGHRKPIASLEEAKGSELKVGDYVLLEDSLRPESCVDEFDLTQYMEGRWYVSGDFEDWIRENVTLERFPGRAARERWQRIHRSHHGVYVTGEEYMAVPELREKPGHMYTEGAIGVWAQTRIPVSAIAYLLGFYIGDGWVHGNKVCFAVENERVDAFLQEVEQLALYANFNPKVRQMLGKSCEIQISSKVLACFFRGITQNGKAASKRIPPQVFQFSDSDLRRFIQGMLDSDGHLSARENQRAWFYVTVSKRLAADLCELLKRIGVIASVNVRTPGLGGIVRGEQIIGKHESYVVYFSDHALQGNNAGHFGKRSPFIMNGVQGQPVKITKIAPEATDFVYDISIDDDTWQTFVASGILVHNTGTAWREDDRQHLIVALSGFPVAIRWAEMISAGVLKRPRIVVATVSNEAAKTNYVKSLVAKRKGRALIFCDWIEQGQALADALDVPFVHGNSPRKLQTIEENEVCVVSRIGDRGISLPDLRLVIEVAGAGSAREQFAQRVGRLLHGDFEGTFVTVFTPEEAAKYRGRVFGVEAELAGSVDIEFIDVGNVTAVTEHAPHKSRVVKQARTSAPRVNGAAQEPADEIDQTLALPAVSAKISLAQKGTSDSRVQGHILNVVRYCWTAALSPKEIMEGLGQTGARTLSRLTGACKAAEKIGLMTVDGAGRYQVDQAEIGRLRALSNLRRTG